MRARVRASTRGLYPCTNLNVDFSPRTFVSKLFTSQPADIEQSSPNLNPLTKRDAQTGRGRVATESNLEYYCTSPVLGSFVPDGETLEIACWRCLITGNSYWTTSRALSTTLRRFSRVARRQSPSLLPLSARPLLYEDQKKGTGGVYKQKPSQNLNPIMSKRLGWRVERV